MYFLLKLVTLFVLAYFIGYLLDMTRKFENPLLKRNSSKFSILITGSGSGLGLDITSTLLKLNDKIIVYAAVRKQSDCSKFPKEALSSKKVICLLLDVSNSTQIEESVEKIQQSSIPLYGVVNNAAIGMPAVTLTSKNNKNYVPALRQVLEVNVFGVAHLTSLLFPSLKNASTALGSARVVNIGSLMGLVYTPRCGGYCASKHALEALSDDWRYELDHDNISVSLVDPGFFASGMCTKKFCEDGPKVCTECVLSALFDQHPVPRYTCASVFGLPASFIAGIIPFIPDRMLDFTFVQFEKVDPNEALPKPN